MIIYLIHFIFLNCNIILSFGISTDGDDVVFRLYNTKSNISQFDVLEPKNAINNAKFIANAQVKILIHGYLQNGSSFEFPQDIKNAFLEQSEDVNVIVVDWGKLANPSKGRPVMLDYPTAANKNVPTVSNRTVELILSLAKANILNVNQIHLIGFSLGTHIAGNTGNLTNFNMKSEGINVVGRVTGLDPAGPIFYSKPNSEKLDKEDGGYVDVIHTDADKLKLFLGYRGKLGQVDYWPNGGAPTQPKCPIVDLLPLPTFCSHLKATEYFARSVRTPKQYTACKAKNYREYKKNNKECSDENRIIFASAKSNASGNYYLDIV